MEEVLISFETAKLAKKKGWRKTKYNYAVWDRAYYILEDDDFFSADKYIGDLIVDEEGGSISCGNILADAPTQSLLQKWLREIHNIIVEVLIFDKGFLEKDKFCYQWRVYNKSEDWFTGLEFKTYEEALEEGLFRALKLIK